jgi:tRNA threonylcarbamoyladenosine biosynthesis protein TsaE
VRLLWKKIFSKEEMAMAAELLLENHEKGKIFLLKGNVGAGKTTLCAALVKKLGFNGKVSSPTFGLINVYLSAKEEEIYHLDLYRIKQKEELLEAGIHETLAGDHYCFVEWPEIIEHEIMIPHFIVELNHHSQGREISLLERE